MSNVLILADFVSSKATKTNAELATVGARIGEVTAVVLAPSGKGAAMAAEINKGPVSKVVLVESDTFVNNGVAAVADVLAQIIAAHSPAAVLIASHAFGKEVAARTAVKSGSGIITDAVDVSADVIATQLVFGGSTTVHSKVSHGTPIITVRPNSIDANVAAATPAVETLSLQVSDASKNATVTYSAIQKVFKSRFDEGRSNARLQDVSNSYNTQLFLSEKRTAYESLLGKNKENFFNVNNYNQTLTTNFNDIVSV